LNNDVAEIKSRLNIVDVLGDYIRLEKAGANFRALCPFHNEKGPSFMVSEERQMWHCFGCQKGGDVFAFVMEMEGLDFREALKVLADKAGVQLQNYNPEATKKQDRTLEILELATKWYEHQLWNGPGKDKIVGYLRERGLKDETIKEFRLGYAPKGWRNVLSFLLGRGYAMDEIARTGLVVEKKDAQIPNSKFQISNQDSNVKIKNDQTDSEIPNTKYKIPDTAYYDRFRERIMFPIRDYLGRVVGYSARLTLGADESQAKYVNTPETDVYHKSKILYGIDKAKEGIKQNKFALLVEGNMDVIAAHQVGLKNAVAVSGTALTAEQVGIIKRYAPKIKMFFDMDAAGEAATKKSVKLCLEKDMAVEVVTLPSGKDAADIARENPKELIKAVEGSLGVMEYFLQKLYAKFDRKKVEDKKKIADECLDIIASFENAVEKSHWIKKLAEGLEIAETALTESLKKISLRSKVGPDSDDREEAEILSPKTKSEILDEELIGLMLVSEDVWKEAKKREDEILSFSKDSLLSRMLSEPEKLVFSFDRLVAALDDPKETERVRKIFFQKKYRIDLNDNTEEVVLENPLEHLEVCVKEMKREKRRDDLMRLTGDLRMAEEKNDRAAIVFLRQEFSRISKEESESAG